MEDFSSELLKNTPSFFWDLSWRTVQWTGLWRLIAASPVGTVSFSQSYFFFRISWQELQCIFPRLLTAQWYHPEIWQVHMHPVALRKNLILNIYCLLSNLIIFISCNTTLRRKNVSGSLWFMLFEIINVLHGLRSMQYIVNAWTPSQIIVLPEYNLPW